MYQAVFRRAIISGRPCVAQLHAAQLLTELVRSNSRHCLDAVVYHHFPTVPHLMMNMLHPTPATCPHPASLLLAAACISR